MKICKECFSDGELRAGVEVISIPDEQICSVCGKNSERQCDLSEFYDFFHSLLCLFKISTNGEKVVDIIQRDWNIFSGIGVAKTIIEEILKTFPDIGFSIDSLVEYNDEVTSLVVSWEDLKVRIKEQTRFLIDNEELESFDFLQSSVTLQKGDILYRSRILPSDKECYDRTQMGCPEKNIATAGRANPVGIPFLYLARDIETTYYEVRASYLDFISVGKFEIQRNLNIIDFHSIIDLYSSFNERNGTLASIVARKKAIEAISSDLSRPMRRFDSEVEYVPTQLVCEFCKTMLNVDGICFESSLHKGYDNYVLFDETSASCVDVTKHQITDIVMQGETYFKT